MSLAGGDTLLLGATLGINDINSNKNNALYIYPNPMTKYSNIEFESPVSGNVTIEIYELTGKKIIQSQNNLQQGRHSFRLSGISDGIYLIQIYSKTYSYSGKLISNSKGLDTPNITYQECRLTEIPANTKNAKIRGAKGTNSTIQMQYNNGDILKITGISDMYQTVFMLIPTSNQTVTFNFAACTDADGNNYSVVQIGTQLWMAENLKTTKYSDGVELPYITDNTTWSNLTTGGYCNYSNTNNTDTINAYGHLYNWHAVTDAGNKAPTGWHAPTDAEWTILTDYLGGVSGAGDKLKESCSIYGFSPNNSTTNETGFTTLPGGARWGNGTFNDIGDSGGFWSSTENNTTFSWHRTIDNGNSVSRLYGYKTAGLSVRCIKD